MAAQVETPLVQENLTMPCCNGHCKNESSRTPLLNGDQFTKAIEKGLDESSVTPQCNSINCPKVIPNSSQCNRTNRLVKRTSHDSGVGCSLDTINEQHECCGGHDHKEAEDAGSQPRNTSVTTLVPCCCQHQHKTEGETGFLPRNSSAPAIRFSRNDSWTQENGNERLDINIGRWNHTYRGNQMPPMATVPNGRIRSKSESCQDFGPHEAVSLGEIERGHFDLIPDCNSANGEYDEVRDDNCEKGEAETPTIVRRDKCAWVVILILSIFVILAAGGIFVVVVQFKLERDVEMKKMEDKIFVLEKSIKKLNQTSSPPSFDMIQGTIADVRPHAHLVLLGEHNIKVNRFQQKVLQWTFGVNKRKTSERLLGYNNKSRSITVQEPGLYFVYNQVYVFRNVLETGKKMDHMYNHTLLHIIYREPANFPSHRKPYIVTESALTQCWDEKANNQIHTSYQGVIVKLQLHDKLSVALENYNEEFDKLVDGSTYFGAFKL